jgi:hypothetical protein
MIFCGHCIPPKSILSDPERTMVVLWFSSRSFVRTSLRWQLFQNWNGPCHAGSSVCAEDDLRDMTCTSCSSTRSGLSRRRTSRFRRNIDQVHRVSVNSGAAVPAGVTARSCRASQRRTWRVVERTARAARRPRTRGDRTQRRTWRVRRKLSDLHELLVDAVRPISRADLPPPKEVQRAAGAS